MSFPPRLPRPPRLIAARLDRLRQRIEARLENPRIPDFNLMVTGNSWKRGSHSAPFEVFRGRVHRQSPTRK